MVEVSSIRRGAVAARIARIPRPRSGLSLAPWRRRSAGGTTFLKEEPSEDLFNEITDNPPKSNRGGLFFQPLENRENFEFFYFES